MLKKKMYLGDLRLRIGKEFIKRRICGAAEENGVLPNVRIAAGRRNWDCGRIGIENLAIVEGLQHRVVSSTTTLPICYVTKPPFTLKNRRQGSCDG